MKSNALVFELADPVVVRAERSVARPVVEASSDDVTGVAGLALWGELLDRVGLVAEGDRRGLRPIGPGGYSGGECYRAVVETQLAGGELRRRTPRASLSRSASTTGRPEPVWSSRTAWVKTATVTASHGSPRSTAATGWRE